MADQNEREAVAQDLDIDERQSEEVAGGADTRLAMTESAAAEGRVQLVAPIKPPKGL